MTIPSCGDFVNPGNASRSAPSRDGTWRLRTECAAVHLGGKLLQSFFDVFFTLFQLTWNHVEKRKLNVWERKIQCCLLSKIMVSPPFTCVTPKLPHWSWSYQWWNCIIKPYSMTTTKRRKVDGPWNRDTSCCKPVFSFGEMPIFIELISHPITYDMLLHKSPALSWSNQCKNNSVSSSSGSRNALQGDDKYGRFRWPHFLRLSWGGRRWYSWHLLPVSVTECLVTLTLKFLMQIHVIYMRNSYDARNI